MYCRFSFDSGESICTYLRRTLPSVQRVYVCTGRTNETKHFKMKRKTSLRERERERRERERGENRSFGLDPFGGRGYAKNMAEKNTRESEKATATSKPPRKRRKKETEREDKLREILVRAFRTCADGSAPIFDRSQVRKACEELGGTYLLCGNKSQASLFVCACAYGAVEVIRMMVEAAHIDLDRARDTVTGRHALSFAASFDCDDIRVCGQACGGAGGQCGLRAVVDQCICILGERRTGKLAILKYLKPMCSAKVIAEAAKKARIVHDEFRSDLEYHQEEYREAMEEYGETDFCFDDDPDCQVAGDNVSFAASMMDALKADSLSAELDA